MKEDRYACIRLENQLCFPLYACAKEVVRRYREPLEELGLTYTQYIVMMAFWEYGGMTEKNSAQSSGWTPAR
jgi:DNA-binding MarR family transcriptional regulator